MRSVSGRVVGRRRKERTEGLVLEMGVNIASKR